jgi:hypothetical protein
MISPTINATDSRTTSACSLASTPTHRITGGQTLTLGHRGVSFIGIVERTDDHERQWPETPPATAASYTTTTDSTPAVGRMGVG